MPTSLETSDGASEDSDVASANTNTETSIEGIHDQRVRAECTKTDQTALSLASKRVKVDNETADEPRKTKRAALLELPLDIWFTLAEHLHPLSLLHLSQLNKTAHRFLTSKSRSERIWTLAEQSIDIPQLEGDWTPMELARLMFDESCQVCGLVVGRFRQEAIFDRTIRVRCHNDCQRALSSITWKHNEAHCSLPLADKALKLVLTSDNGWCRIADLHETIQQLFKLESIRASGGDHTAALAALRNEREKRKAMARADSDKIFEWLRKAHYAKRDALAASDKIRHKNAQKRLDRLGYTSIDCSFYLPESLDPLTDQEWVKIGPTIISRAEKKQYERLNNLDNTQLRYRGKLEPWYENTKHEWEDTCSFSLFLGFPSVKLFWQNPGVPPLDRDAFATALPLITSDCAKADRTIKLSFLREYTRSRNRTLRPIDQSVMAQLSPWNHGVPRQNLWRTNTGDSFELDLSDTPPISVSMVKTLLDSFTCEFWLPTLTEPMRWTQVHDSFDKRFPRWPELGGKRIKAIGKGQEEFIDLLPEARDGWTQFLHGVLEVTGLENGNHLEVKERLEALGESFSCRCFESEEILFTYSEFRLHALGFHLVGSNSRDTEIYPKSLIVHKTSAPAVQTNSA